MASVRVFLSRLSQTFKRRPLVTNVVSFGALYVSAEVSQQIIERKLLNSHKNGISDEPTNLDLEALKRYAVIGTVGIGPVLYFWYRFLDWAIPARTAKFVIAKVVTDQLISSPACIAIFFVGMSALEKKDDIYEELKTKFLSTYTLSCCFWPTIQAINFGFLPAHTRVAFVGAASFVWCNVLCLVKRRKPKTEVLED